ncbi:MAG: hypothetical protein LBF17_02670 [Mediterranea sp.]|jgi:hypothetical protein|nr:hypothetical protein [Mediterranea sp.]
MKLLRLDGQPHARRAGSSFCWDMYLDREINHPVSHDQVRLQGGLLN